MKTNRTASLFKRAIMASVLALSPIAANADVYYQIVGKVFDIKDQTISVSDRYFPVSPTLKVYGLDGKKSSLANLKEGDPIRMTIMILDRKRMVDRIDRIAESDLR